MPETGAELNAQTDNVAIADDHAEPEEDNLSQKDGSDPSSDGDDGWGDARKAFHDGLDSDDHDAVGSDANKSKATDKADGEVVSHLENDQAGQTKEKQDEESDSGELNLKYSLDDLRLPQKYKPDVQKKVDAILADAKTQASQLNQGFKESNTAFAKAFVDIIQSDNPLQTLHEYAGHIVDAYRLPKETLSKLQQRLSNNENNAADNGNNRNTDNQKTIDVAAIQQRLANEIKNIEEKYWQQLEQEQDPKRARDIFSRMEMEKMALHNEVNNAKLKAVLQAFYGKLIKPQFDEFGKIKNETESAKAIAERNAKVSLWNSADQQMVKKFSDWPKYKAQVKQLMKTKYGSQKDYANESGNGHLELMQDLYLIASRQDHLEAAKQPNRGLPGFKPSGKHITTQKAGGSGWDDIKKNHWGDIIPED